MVRIASIDEAVKLIDAIRNEKLIVATSGGVDPLHFGHVRCIKESKLIANDVFLVFILNGDGFLSRKKGKPFMPFAERAEIMAAIRWVDLVVGWDDGTQTVCGALEKLRPAIFTKGGDRSARAAVPEAEICDAIGCRIEYGVGGTDKVQSSSSLIAGAK